MPEGSIVALEVHNTRNVREQVEKTTCQTGSQTPPTGFDLFSQTPPTGFDLSFFFPSPARPRRKYEGRQTYPASEMFYERVNVLP